MLIRVAKREKLKSEYKLFIDQADKLKTETDGLVNMYKTGSVKATALKLFQDKTKAVEEAENIQGVEADWILDCYRAGTLCSQPYEGVAYKYDVCSMYSFIMASKRDFPYKAGQFVKITQEEMSKWLDKDGKQYFKYGIYRAVITGDIKKPLFRANSLNRFSHIDLEVAYEEGYNIHLVEDGACNYLCYPPNTRIKGTQLFKSFVDELYPIKEQHDKDIPEKNFSYAKKLLNILWGALSEKRIYNEIRTKESKPNEEIVLGVNEQIDNNIFLGNDDIIYETEKTEDVFMTGFARIMPFITAHGRKMVRDVIRENNIDLDCIKRIHTDGIVTSVPFKKEYPNKKDAKLGELGYEGCSEHCVVKNMGKPVGEFKIL